MISVVLIEPHVSGNIGSVARAMKNFGLKNLILVNPKCDHLSGEAKARAKHARLILKNAVIVKKFSNLKFDTLVATTASLGRDYNVARLPLTPEQLGEKYIELNKSKTALVFGRDTTGLTNSEILKCDFVVSIPASTNYSVLNISHAASIIFYELSKKSRINKIGNFTAATSKEKDVIMKLIDSLLRQMPFHFDTKRETQRRIWRRLIGKAMLSRREAFAVIGFLKKIKLR
ncbi:RNA methyltransferase [Candidatus Woesearchaeota archaeon]|nr:RNA methyltransferase [Candidatus Woesearchaeota archaeon]|tara:strand:+ start:17315 stop:18007 length:693 start_codon:yes stop_codon:yes gene_type:complete